MPSLRDLRRRTQSVKNTQQITKAMKMVSAAKLRRAQDAVVQSRAYSEKLGEVMAGLATESGLREHPLVRDRTGGEVVRGEGGAALVELDQEVDGLAVEGGPGGGAAGVEPVLEALGAEVLEEEGAAREVLGEDAGDGELALGEEALDDEEGELRGGLVLAAFVAGRRVLR